MSSSEESFLKFVFFISLVFSQNSTKEKIIIFFCRRSVLPSSVANYSKTSPEFFQALKKAATIRDCVNPENPLDISHRTRYQYEASDLGCFTERLGFHYPQETDLAFAFCPSNFCLGTFCQMVSLFPPFFPPFFLLFSSFFPPFFLLFSSFHFLIDFFRIPLVVMIFVDQCSSTLRQQKNFVQMNQNVLQKIRQNALVFLDCFCFLMNSLGDGFFFLICV